LEEEAQQLVSLLVTPCPLQGFKTVLWGGGYNTPPNEPLELSNSIPAVNAAGTVVSRGAPSQLWRAGTTDSSGAMSVLLPDRSVASCIVGLAVLMRVGWSRCSS
jgi:hypothetical protein